MFHSHSPGAILRWSACLAALTGVLAPAASAEIFQLDYTGAFSSADALNAKGSPTAAFTSTTPFTATALFDESSPNLAAPVGVPGFVAYSPISATITVGGQTYNIATYAQNPTAGISVAVFDNTTPFGMGHYAVGFLQNPLADGAGFVGDWLSASPTFSAQHLVSTTFTDYVGVGYGSGPDFGQGPTVVPIPLNDKSGNPFLLTLGNYDENYGPNGPLNTARLVAVPEASSFGLLALGLGLIGVTRRRRA